MSFNPLVEVGVALILREGRYLIARRKPHVHMGGLWEFPGGKCEEGECPEECVRREVLEELGVEITPPIYLMRHTHEYVEKTVALIVFDCSIKRGEPEALDCAEFRWVRPHEIGELEFPPADVPIITVLLEREGEGR